MSAVKKAVTSVVNTVTGNRNTATKAGNTSPAITRNRNSLLTATELKNMLKNQAVQARAAKSRAKAEIVEAPLEWINSAGAWLDKGITKAVGYNDASFRGQYDYMVAEWITEAECAAYDYCINTLQKLLPKADVERVLKGTGLIIGGAFKEIGGIMLTAASTTVSWAGIGIPGMGAGIITASAGASDIQQGIEEVLLGLHGDSITKTTNGFCDMLYDGNEFSYHLSTGISGIDGNLLTPYVMAVYSENPITAAEALKTTEKKPVTKEEGTPGTYEICEICNWEDDELQFKNPIYAGGANVMNLEDARKEYLKKQQNSKI